MDIQGLVYLLNEAGTSLAKANEQINGLIRQNEELKAQLQKLQEEKRDTTKNSR